MNVDIKHLAKLSRLSISQDQEQKFHDQMTSILEMVEKLPPIENNASLVDPNKAMELRTDISENNFKRDELLQNAPQVQAGCVVVPKVVE